MTQPSLCRHLLSAAAGLLGCALATVAAIHITPVWAKVLCLIAAATALCTAAKALWAAARPAFHRGKSHGPGVVYLHGEISAATASRTTRRLTDALATRPTALDIDMSKVQLLTSDGAMAFLAAARVAHKQGIDLTVRNASPQARATLHTLGLDQLQHYHDG
ncbi:STAS domain-containing protein [Streptomyces phaeochromogenes]|uniref:STAS domain-containing protein n=1 Tax=Streptomyces phaeochromogenes TaxID=1923 RepID=UPI002E2BAF46|nr:STAS domain-containing protein [Streptomyces phaeochromogenes]